MPEVIMPKMGDAMETGTLVAWRKRSGDEVKPGDVLGEIETDKSNVEIEAEEAGRFEPIAAEGAEVPVGAVIATIGDVSPVALRTPPVVAVVAPAPLVAVVRTIKPAAVVYDGPTINIAYREAIHMALDEEMERDPNVFLAGEDIGQYQGTFKITQGMLEKYGPERVVDTPISEEAMVGMATGAAMMGLRPVLEFMTFNFAMVAFDQIVNNAAKILDMSGGQFNVPCVLRGPGGVGTQLSAQHSQDVTHWYANTPGLKVVLPATPADAKGLLKAAIRDDNPVIFMEHAKLYGMRGEVPTDKEFVLPIGVAEIKRTGADVTIIACSRGVIQALAAAEQLASQGIDAEVIDLRSLLPIDTGTVIESVKKTHRAVVVQEQWPYFGMAAEFSAQIMEEAFDYLDAPVERVTGAFVPMPFARPLEDLAIPHEEDIVKAARKTLERSV